MTVLYYWADKEQGNEIPQVEPAIVESAVQVAQSGSPTTVVLLVPPALSLCLQQVLMSAYPPAAPRLAAHQPQDSDLVQQATRRRVGNKREHRSIRVHWFQDLR